MGRRKIAPNRTQLLDILAAGPAKFLDLALGSKNHRVRKPLRAAIDGLMAEGVLKMLYLGGTQYIALADWEPSGDMLLRVIEDNCRRTVDGCLVWTGHTDPIRGPMYRLNGVPTSIRRMVWQTKRGLTLGYLKTVKPVVCDNWECVEYRHLAAVKRGNASIGKPLGLLRIQRIAETMRASKGKITMDIARQIRLSSDSERTESAKWDISPAIVGQIRRNETWKEYGMFSGLVKRAA